MSIQQRPTQTPDGYVPIQMEDGERYLVPRFVVPATHQAFDAYRVKADINNTKGEVSFFPFFWNFMEMAMMPMPAKLTRLDFCSLEIWPISHTTWWTATSWPCLLIRCVSAWYHFCGDVNSSCCRYWQTGSCWVAMLKSRRSRTSWAHSTAIHGRGWEAATARSQREDVCDFEEQDGK